MGAACPRPYHDRPLCIVLFTRLLQSSSIPPRTIRSSSDEDGDSSDSDSDSDVEEAGSEDGEETEALESAAVAAPSQPSQPEPVAAAGTTTLNEATSSTGPYGSIPMGLLDRSSELLFPYGEEMLDIQACYAITGHEQ